MSRPKIVSRISDGLGNQMFMYAAARRLALKNDAELVLDTRNGFSRDSYNRSYQLDQFNIAGRPATAREAMRPFNRLRRKILKRRETGRPLSQCRLIRQNGIDLDRRILDLEIDRDVYMEGYWQGETYFADIADTIRTDLTFTRPIDITNQAMADKISQCAMPISIHVRFFAPPGTDESDNAAIAYYRQAFTAAEAAHPDAHYFIFSDRPQDACTMLGLPEERFTAVTHNDTDAAAPYDMWLMRQCRHFIIANSTFSWWGAWLGNAPDKQVYAPFMPVSKDGHYKAWNITGLIPDNWNKVSLAER